MNHEPFDAIPAAGQTTLPGNRTNHPPRGRWVKFTCSFCSAPFEAFVSDRQTPTPTCGEILRLPPA